MIYMVVIGDKNPRDRVIIQIRNSNKSKSMTILDVDIDETYKFVLNAMQKWRKNKND